MTLTPTNCPTIDLNLPGCVAFSTLRGECDATDPYSSLNACFYVGDDPLHVARSQEIVAAAAGIAPERLIIPRQTHSSNVVVVAGDCVPDLEGVDGMVTDCADIALCINTADCVPVVMSDPERGVVAAVHSGWRGTVAGISLRAVELMESLGCRAENINVAMGPCICSGCFEVGEEVADRFRELIPASDLERVVTRQPGCKPHVDLPAAIAIMLENRGVEHVKFPPLCSMCNPDLLFSARRLGISSGRTLTVVRLADRGAQKRR